MTRRGGDNGCDTLIVGVPRSGTSALHALTCTSLEVNPYMGEASYLRSMLMPFRQARAVFDQHTRYVFSSLEDLQKFHANLMREVLEQYRRATGMPHRLVLKDPLLTGAVGEMNYLLPEVRVVLMLRNPGDVIASRLRVQERAGRIPDPSRLIDEHNTMLGTVIDTWNSVRPQLITYPMLQERGLTEIKSAFDLYDIDTTRLWSRSVKKYPDDGQKAWTTPLFGAPLRRNNKGRYDLPHSLLERVERECLPPCLEILRLAGKRSSSYWKPAQKRFSSS